MIGLAIGLWYVRRCDVDWRVGRYLLLLFIFLANAPDMDYLPGLICGDLNRYHHLVTHSLVWSVSFAGGIWLIWRGYRERVGRAALGFMMLATCSHLLVDMVTQDGAAPYGVMVLWPIRTDYIQAPFWVFGMMAKDHLAMVFQWGNFVTMLQELAITFPLVLLAGWRMVIGCRAV